MRVLLLDHDAERADIVRLALADAGCQVIICPSDIHGLLMKVRECQPDVIIIDLDSPDRDSLEQLRCVTREQPKPIVMFVDHSDDASTRAAIEAGVMAYIVDGLSTKRIRPIVEIAIARFQAFQALRDELEQAKASLAERKLIERAKGILIRERSMTEEAAYRTMRKMAMDQNKRLADIAQSIVTVASVLKG